jgi:MoaA/NifB/PqqE/SkfB family radical SAM enzyme
VSAPILQVHATRHCNLACRHCYSTSGPREHARLPIRILRDALEDAAALGYRVLSVSGGEPFLYPDLHELLGGARALGLKTSVVTNGYLVGRAPYLRCEALIDTLVLSIDGPPELHSRVRGDPRAFDVLQAALARLRADARPFALVHTVTRSSWQHLDWVIEFAESQGARGLQFHPLEKAGRAIGDMADESLDDEELTKLYLMAPLLTASSAAGVRFHVDLVHPQTLQDSPELFMDELPRPLVIEEDGTVSPCVYGMPRSLACGNLLQHRLAHCLTSWQSGGGPARLRHIVEPLRQAIIEDRDSTVVNWFEALLEASHGAPSCCP